MPSRALPLLVLLLLALSSCALDRVTVLPAQPAGEAGLAGGNGRRVHLVVPLEDDRPVRNRCGMQKNGYNMDTADVVCTRPPQEWIAELLAGELRRAGFELAPEAGPGVLRVEGTLLQYFIEPKVDAFTISPEADVHVRLVASTDAGLLAERSFFVKGRETALVSTAGYFQDASDAAARQIVRDMVVALVDLLDRYPGAGDAVPAT